MRERSLLHAARDFLERIDAADGGEIFSEKLVRARQHSFCLAGFFPFIGCRPGLFVSEDGCDHRIRRAAVARVAGDQAVALEVVFIDRHHHVNHLARGDLGLLSSFSFACATWQYSHSTPSEAAMNCIEGIT